jgi:hypothetical protein
MTFLPWVVLRMMPKLQRIGHRNLILGNGSDELIQDDAKASADRAPNATTVSRFQGRDIQCGFWQLVHQQQIACAQQQAL